VASSVPVGSPLEVVDVAAAIVARRDGAHVCGQLVHHLLFVVVLMCGIVVDIVVPGRQSTPREHDQGEEKVGVPKSRGSGW
jgi:hypothetical protein